MSCTNACVKYELCPFLKIILSRAGQTPSPPPPSSLSISLPFPLLPPLSPLPSPPSSLPILSDNYTISRITSVHMF